MIGPNERLASLQVDRLQVFIYSSRRAPGEAAAQDVAARMRIRLREFPRISMIFAAAPSQNEFLAALGEPPDLDWGRVIAFQMDEYIGLPSDAPQSFGRFLGERLFDRVQPGAIHYFNTAQSPAEEITRYCQMISETPPAITRAGIGENGHLGFNDPPFADFQDLSALRT